MTTEDAQNFLAFLRQNRPDQYAMAIEYIKAYNQAPGMTLGEVAVPATTSTWSSITTALQSGVNSISSMSASYQDYKKQKEMLKLQAQATKLQQQQEANQAAIISAQSQQKMEMWTTIKALGLPVVILIGFYIAKTAKNSGAKRQGATRFKKA